MLQFGGASHEVKEFSLVGATAYATVGIWPCPSFKSKILTFSSADKDIVVTTYYSQDGGKTWTAKDADFDVMYQSAAVVKTYNDVYSHIKVTAKNRVAGQVGTLSLVCFGTIIDDV
jgi:hypothetical protein